MLASYQIKDRTSAWCHYNLFIIKYLDENIFHLYYYIVCFFSDRYDYIGKLLKPGQEATSYSDEEEETTNQETVTEKPKEE